MTSFSIHRYSLAVFLVLLATLVGVTAGALDVPPRPPLERPVVDQTETLTEDQIDTLSQRINNTRTHKNIQMAILIVPSLQGESLEQYSLKVARSWGVGEKDKNNGVLLFIAKDDRRVRIEVGRGQEGDITDAESGRIIRNTLAPAFQEGDYYGGIFRATHQILSAAAGDKSAIPNEQPAKAASTGEMILFGLFFLFPLLSWFGSILGRSKSWWAGGVIGAIGGGLLILAAGFATWALIGLVVLVIFGLMFDYGVSKNYKRSRREGHDPSWWAGGGFGGFGGGSSGGGSFGGGGFGGGGSSGSW